MVKLSENGKFGPTLFYIYIEEGEEIRYGTPEISRRRIAGDSDRTRVLIWLPQI